MDIIKNHLTQGNFMRILIDMDGVIADWEGSVSKLFGIEPDWSNNQTNIVEALKITKSQLWNKINSTPNFWEDISPLPWKNELINLSLTITQDVYICTSPGIADPLAVAGKARWINKHLPHKFRKDFVFTAHKHLLANKDTILIDDNEKQYDNFSKYGGIPFLFPSKSNRNRSAIESPMESFRDWVYYCKGLGVIK